jgi:hypothetical protein
MLRLPDFIRCSLTARSISRELWSGSCKKSVILLALRTGTLTTHICVLSPQLCAARHHFRLTRHIK